MIVPITADASSYARFWTIAVVLIVLVLALFAWRVDSRLGQILDAIRALRGGG